MCETCGCKPLARSDLYRFIAAGFSYPDPALVEFLRNSAPDAEHHLSLFGDERTANVLRALMPVLASCSPDQLAAQYVGVFGHTMSKECPPYETEYGQAHIFQKSQTLADIAGFYQAFGLELEPSFKDRLDHISAEMEFMHFLCLKEAYALATGHAEAHTAVCREAQAKFLGEHVGQWVLEFACRLERKAEGGVYSLLGQLTQAFVTYELATLGVQPGEVRRPALAELPGDGPAEAPTDEAAACEACPLLVPIVGGGG